MTRFTKIDSSSYYYDEGYNVDTDGKYFVIRFLPALRFDSLRKTGIAIDLWRKGNGDYKKWFSIAWLLAINPKNYNGVYGRLTKKRLELRKKLLK
jgi:hypothetical protein